MSQVQTRFKELPGEGADGYITVTKGSVSLVGEAYEFKVYGNTIERVFNDEEYPAWAWEAAKNELRNGSP